MQQLDHDMDDLFRKAAESYPLKTDVDDWEKIAAKLVITPPATVVAPVKRSRYYFLSFLFVLLSLLLSSLYFYHWSSRSNTYKPAAALSSIKSDGKSLSKNGVGTNKTPPDLVVDNDKAHQETHLYAPRNILVHANGYGKAKKLFLPGVRSSGNVYHTRQTKLSKSAAGYSANNSNSFSDNDHLSGISMPSLNSTVVTGLPFVSPFTITAPELRLMPRTVSGHYSQVTRGFYAGVNGGPELSKVGSQADTRTGYQAGILIGYQLNLKWSIESGVMIGKNNYYSNGSYFNMSKVASSMPVGMEIVALHGQSKHIEIPVIAKFNFLRNRQSKLFFTGGLLSDIYLQEKNHYQTMLNGIADNQVGLYDQNKFMPASQLRISIGYEHRLGRSGSIRIEPYKNIPLQKTGMGSMAVFSSGFNVSLLHKFKSH